MAKPYSTPRECYRKAPVLRRLSRDEREQMSELVRRDFLKSWVDGTGRKRVKRSASHA
jgi:hypothetical protein